MKIWALFSIANDYDQPDNNLVAWWQNKPKIEVLAQTIGINFDRNKGSVKLGKILKGQGVRIDGADFRLVEITEGVTL